MLSQFRSFASIAEPELKHSLQTQPDEETTPAPAETALAPVDHRAHWSSAAAARAFLEQMAGGQRSGALRRFLTARRGDFYLALALILVACVIRWGIWSNHSVGATGSPSAVAGHHKPAPNADLSLFDRMLVQLGLAEAPDPPEDKGNPNTEVWVDLQTALYYCPGAELYGKTPKGSSPPNATRSWISLSPPTVKPVTESGLNAVKFPISTAFHLTTKQRRSAIVFACLRRMESPRCRIKATIPTTPAPCRNRT